jgi:hypothetical protein
VLDLQLDQKIDGASGCLHSCMHAARLRVIPWKLACTACCTARLYNLVWTSFAPDFGLKLNWETPGNRTWCTHSVSRMEPETRVDKVRYWTAVARLFRGVDCVQVESMEGGWIWS